MFESCVGEDIKKGCNKGDGCRKGSDAFMSNTNYQEIENLVLSMGRMVTILR
jgi:hypothetical protein